MIEAGRVLGLVLGIGALVWIGAAVTEDRDLTAGAQVWSTALMLISLGVWAPVLSSRNILSVIGAVLAFAGTALMTVLILRRVVTATELENLSTMKEIAVALIGAGVAFIGAGIATMRGGSMLLGAMVILAGAGWGIYGFIDYGTEAEHLVSIVPAVALLLVGLVTMWPRFLNVFAGRSGPGNVEHPLGVSREPNDALSLVARTQTAPRREKAPRPAKAAASPAAPAPPAAPVVAAPAGPAEADDLTRIKGIGPGLKEKLRGLGVTTFRQIADFTPADVERINKALAFSGRIERDNWVDQAKELAG